MANWVEFTHDYDHHWPSGAVTAFKVGDIMHVKAEVAHDAIKAGAAKKSEKPKPGEEAKPVTDDTPKLHRDVVREVKAGGHVHGITGNPFRRGAHELPDPADPDAIRSEPLVERDRARTDAGLPDSETDPDEESASQVPAE